MKKSHILFSAKPYKHQPRHIYYSFDKRWKENWICDICSHECNQYKPCECCAMKKRKIKKHEIAQMIRQWADELDYGAEWTGAPELRIAAEMHRMADQILEDGDRPGTPPAQEKE